MLAHSDADIMAQLGLGHVGIWPSPPFIHWDHSFSCSTTFSLSCCNNLFFCRSSKSTLVFLMDKAPGARPARACAHECLLGRSVADIMCIAVHIQYVLRSPCALMHDPAFLKNLHLL